MTRLSAVALLLLLLSGCSTPRPAPWQGADWLASTLPGLTAEFAPADLPRALVDDEDEADDDDDTVLGTVLWYLPNRFFDVLDIVRARVRLGPGFGLDVRATQLADLFIGSYWSVYVGLPGPRGRVIPVLPAGLETRTGLQVSVVDATLEGFNGPDYGTAEFGLGFQLAIIGVDVGVDPLEIIDFVVGLFTFDIQDDDF
ncbi:MAG: hypothetical protein ACI9EF_003341 [Pseudohongiellaceae bacterium]|jgi:hypothetical protein